MNTLYYGDNLKVLREHIKDESVDLIYLDPPFNSNRSYNVLFKDESGSSSDAQITAFDDSWHWGDQAQSTFTELVTHSSGNIGQMINSLYQFIGANQMMAYLVMMAARLVELHRVLKPTGSLYLHCDPTASHYLKILLDMIFGVENFRNEISWQRTSSHNDSKKWGAVHDILLYYSKSNNPKWNPVFTEHDPKYIENFYNRTDIRGVYRLDHIIRSATMGPRPNLSYEFKGYKPEWGWRCVREKLEALDKDNRIEWSASGRPYLKRYLDEQKGTPIKDVIIDIPPIGAQAAERLGYPTQKPLALLERIIQASSNPGDVVLDPFSGCGTCITAAQKLGRQWIGIDITHLAIAMHKSRLKDHFQLEPKRDYRVIGEPEDLNGAHQLALDDRFQFEAWAISLIEARPMNRPTHSEPGQRDIHKGSDRGIDGFINFLDRSGLKRALVQVKSGHVNRGLISQLKGDIEREGAQMGIFITLEPPTREMTTEALTAGNYRSELWEKDFPRIQILTIEDLLAGAEVRIPQTPTDATAFKQAGKIKKDGPKQGELDL